MRYTVINSTCNHRDALNPVKAVPRHSSAMASAVAFVYLITYKPVKQLIFLCSSSTHSVGTLCNVSMSVKYQKCQNLLGSLGVTYVSFIMTSFFLLPSRPCCRKCQSFSVLSAKLTKERKKKKQEKTVLISFNEFNEKNVGDSF